MYVLGHAISYRLQSLNMYIVRILNNIDYFRHSLFLLKEISIIKGIKCKFWAYYAKFPVRMVASFCFYVTIKRGYCLDPGTINC